jgi:2-polyprenyl-3-methyl-5-hydroxy-6-metoxy-1,4-benzoquinol methylase
MNIIPWRISNFFNVHFHSLYMLIKYRTTNLNSEKHWNERFASDEYEGSHSTENVFNAILDAITPGASVCDVGVGTGLFLKKAREEKKADVFAIDISPVIIDKLKESGINGVVCELPSIPKTNRTFDFITAKAVLEHLKYPRKSIETLATLLNPGGKLIVSVPNDSLGPEDEPEHFRKYDAQTLREELRDYVNVDSIDVIDNCLVATCARR